MSWSAVRTDDGSYTLAHPEHGEACHSRAGAWQEARERYARECRVRERALEIARCARDAEDSPTLRVLDVGTGLGLNLAAALEALDGCGVALEAVSLESEPTVIRAAIDLYESLSAEERAALPAGLERWHALVRDALKAALHREASSNVEREPFSRAPMEVSALAGHAIAGNKGSVRLLIGDARSTLSRLAEDARFDAVFLDPFSPAIDEALWEHAFLSEVARRMSPRSMLSTYTASLRVRASLCAAGLRVGPGARVGTKASGTIASPDLDLAPFDARTARRIERRAAAARTSPGVRPA